MSVFVVMRNDISVQCLERRGDESHTQLNMRLILLKNYAFFSGDSHKFAKMFDVCHRSLNMTWQKNFVGKLLKISLLLQVVNV